MQIEQWNTDDVIPYPQNPRVNDGAVAAVAKSLAAFGFRQPIVVDAAGVIVVGHTRWKAAKRLGWTQVPVHVATDLTAEQLQAYRIADNQLNTLAAWDDDLLSSEMQALEAVGFDLELLGFDPDELLMRLHPEGGPGLCDPDEVPPAPAEPTTQPGDLWLLGEHRLLCGDSTRTADVERLMHGRRADLWLTDPPYNVAYTGKTKDALTIANDAMTDGEFREFLNRAFTCAFAILKPGAAFYLWHADSEGYNFRGAVRDCGQQVRQCLVWKKNAFVMGRQDYHWQHEPCLYGWKAGAAHGWYSDRAQTTVLEFDRPQANAEHPTMKPAALFAYLVGNSSAPQGLVYDGFLGSGTTLIAAEQLGRTCYGLELSPQYCDVIVARWQQFTGKQAERVTAGKEAA
jgi:DNA modification methylase